MTVTTPADFCVVQIQHDQDAAPAIVGGATSCEQANAIAAELAESGVYAGELRVMERKDAEDLVALIPTGPDPQAADQLAAHVEKRRELIENDPDKTADVDADPEPDEPDEPADQPPPDPDGKALFDDSVYEREELAIAKVDGQQIDRIAIGVTGEVMLDRSDVADVALYNRLQLGKTAELWIEGRVQGTGAKGATSRDGDLDVVVGKKTIKVESIRVVQPEELTSLVSTEAFKLVAERALNAGVDADDLHELLDELADARTVQS